MPHLAAQHVFVFFFNYRCICSTFGVRCLIDTILLFQLKISDVSFQALSAELSGSRELFLEKLNTTLKSAVCAVCKYSLHGVSMSYRQTIAVIPSLGLKTPKGVKSRV